MTDPRNKGISARYISQKSIAIGTYTVCLHSYVKLWCPSLNKTPFQAVLSLKGIRGYCDASNSANCSPVVSKISRMLQAAPFCIDVSHNRPSFLDGWRALICPNSVRKSRHVWTVLKKKEPSNDLCLSTHCENKIFSGAGHCFPENVRSKKIVFVWLQVIWVCILFVMSISEQTKVHPSQFWGKTSIHREVNLEMHNVPICHLNL